MSENSNPAENLPQRFKKVKAENAAFFKKLKNKPPADLDQQVRNLDEEVFARINCLDCANCCKTTGPLFTQRDIERIARHQKMKPGDFSEKFLRRDEDQDLVLKQLPCPFLGLDNHCSIYEVRPEACADYPHTQRRKQHSLLKLMEKNAGVCPAVFEIVEQLKDENR